MARRLIYLKLDENFCQGQILPLNVGRRAVRWCFPGLPPALQRILRCRRQHGKHVTTWETTNVRFLGTCLPNMVTNHAVKYPYITGSTNLLRCSESIVILARSPHCCRRLVYNIPGCIAIETCDVCTTTALHMCETFKKHRY